MLFILINIFTIINIVNAKCLNVSYEVNLENVTNEYYDWFTTTETGIVTFLTYITPCDSNLDIISLQGDNGLVYGIDYIKLYNQKEITKDIPYNITFRLNYYIYDAGKECNFTLLNGTLCYPTKKDSKIKEDVEKNNSLLIKMSLLYLIIISMILVY